MPPAKVYVRSGGNIIAWEVQIDRDLEAISKPGNRKSKRL